MFLLSQLCWYCSRMWCSRVMEYSSNCLSLQLVQAFTRCAAVVDGRRGGRFQLLEGNISGCFTRLLSLVQVQDRFSSRTTVVPDGLTGGAAQIFACRLNPFQKWVWGVLISRESAFMSFGSFGFYRSIFIV